MTSSVTLPIIFRAIGVESEGSLLAPITCSITSLQPDELLIRVVYASVNAMDPKLWQVNAYKLQTPYVLGFDFSGTVVAVGAGGEAETAAPEQHQQQEAISVGSEVMGSSRTGGCFAEYVVAKRKECALRGTIPPPEASTYGIAFLTAYESLMLADSLTHRRGQSIFIPGAAGGVGHFAVQLARLHELRVIGSASRPESLALLERLGVDDVIDYSKQDVVKEVLALTNGQGVDIAYDSTYQAASMLQSASCVKAGGVWVKLGQRGSIGSVDDTEAVRIAEQRGASCAVAYIGRYFREPDYMAQQHRLIHGLRQAVGWHREGKLRPHITAVLPFDAQALQRVFDSVVKEKKSLVGKVVLKVAS
jgi:NADPH2:quinone reductase